MQVKPFILRRTKDTVLADLPPKILQDVFVDASPLQRSLYQDFAASDATQEVQGALDAGNPADAEKAPHVFQVGPRLHMYAHLTLLSSGVLYTHCITDLTWLISYSGR